MPLNIRSILNLCEKKEALVHQLQQWNLIPEEGKIARKCWNETKFDSKIEADQALLKTF